MRKIISFTHASLDGFISGLNGEMDWIAYNDEIFKDAIELSSTADAAIYGRVTYKGMESYWPTVLTNPDSSPDDLHHAKWIDNIHKIVLTKSLQTAEWQNTTLIHDNIAEEMTKLKVLPGKNMLIFGSPRATHSLAALGLIDEYRINFSPVILGAGVPLFQAGMEKTNLKLLESKTFDLGVVAVRYQVVR